MRIPKYLDVPLAQWLPIGKYKPRVGDLVVRHGWFTHYFGFITKVNESRTLSIVRAGVPQLLLTMPPEDVENNIVILPLSKIHRSRGEYAIFQDNIWYIG